LSSTVNILFVCSRNQWRSPTAEEIYKNKDGIKVRSAGTEASARIKINAKTIAWANIIFVMEKKHKQRIQEKYSSELSDKEMITLDIPDDYQFMDPDLIEEITTKVNYYLYER